jgi:hypothetical protein
MKTTGGQWLGVCAPTISGARRSNPSDDARLRKLQEESGLHELATGGVH